MVNLLKTNLSKNLSAKQDAENIAVSVFGFLAREPEYFANFATQTGIEIADIAEVASTPQFLHAVLGFVLSDQSLLLTFCQSSGQRPEIVDKAYQKLGEFDAI